MNWKDVPHLFANGKFDAIAKPKDYPDEHVLIIGVRWLRDDPTCWNIRGYSHEFKSECLYSVRECTLIARPIEDMSDEEMRQLPNLDKSSSREMIDWYKESLEDNIGIGISSIDFLRLLSIGVYPFDQSHFDDGTVIDSTTL